jgi:hypothetical protein
LQQFHIHKRPPTDVEDVLDCFDELGFDMKLQMLDVDDATFLKGMWYYTQENVQVWGPLPSRILKMGKSFENPLRLYPRRPAEEAALKFLGDVANSYKPFLPVPIVSTFVNNFAKEEVLQTNYIGPYKTKPTGMFSKYRLSNEGISQIERRYNVSAKDLQLTADALPKIPFQFLESPVYHAFAERDYA